MNKNPRLSPQSPRTATSDSIELQSALIAGVFIGFILLLLLPLIVVFVEAFRKGWTGFFQTFSDPAARHAIQLTVTVALISVPLNLIFGIVAGWAMTRYEFRGKSLLITLIDLPFSVSPVVSGIIYILLFGIHSRLGSFLDSVGIQIIFAVPGIVLATLFVTFPFVAREIIPTMQATGRDEEQAAYLLGANGWQIFFRITLPNIRWSLLYGVLLCNARAMGEFGAVSVVSGHIRGYTNTVPLHIEILYNEYNFVAAFSMAVLMAFLAVLTLIAKTALEKVIREQSVEKLRERLPNRTPLHQIPTP